MGRGERKEAIRIFSLFLIFLLGFSHYSADFWGRMNALIVLHLPKKKSLKFCHTFSASISTPLLRFWHSVYLFQYRRFLDTRDARVLSLFLFCPSFHPPPRTLWTGMGWEGERGESSNNREEERGIFISRREKSGGRILFFPSSSHPWLSKRERGGGKKPGGKPWLFASNPSPLPPFYFTTIVSSHPSFTNQPSPSHVSPPPLPSAPPPYPCLFQPLSVVWDFLFLLSFYPGNIWYDSASRQKKDSTFFFSPPSYGFERLLSFLFFLPSPRGYLDRMVPPSPPSLPLLIKKKFAFFFFPPPWKISGDS